MKNTNKLTLSTDKHRQGFSPALSLVFSLAALVVSLMPLSLALASSQMSQQAPAGSEWIEKIQGAMAADVAVIRPLDLETNVIPSAVRVRLSAIADDQAQIWGDTILEGDYYAEEAVQLDAVEAILIDGALVGYRITYSSVAYETSACEVSMNQDLAASGCCPGRIFESSFVAPGLDSWTRDSDAYAEFVADEA